MNTLNRQISAPFALFNADSGTYLNLASLLNRPVSGGFGGVVGKGS